MKGFLVNEVQSAFVVHEYFGEPKAVHDWAKDQSGWCPNSLESRFITGIESYSRVVPWIYCCNVVDFGKAAECPLAPIV